MNRKYRPACKKILILGVIAFWLPFAVIVWQSRSAITPSIADLPHADAVIVFGAIVRDHEITPLQEQRLLAAKAIWATGHADKIVVSNLNTAADVMADYLKTQNVPDSVIEIDNRADNTPDTCRFEKEKHPEGRRLIFVSQGFHLPRVLYQCQKWGVTATAFPAEKLAASSSKPPNTVSRWVIKSQRYTREAFLTWLAVLGFYK